jgi:hypothetical protein
MGKDDKPKDEKPKLNETVINGGRSGALDRMVKCWEHLRGLNKNGYSSTKGGILVKIEGFPRSQMGDTGTTCSPFTATVIMMMFDPDIGDDFTEPFKPLYGGDNKKALPCNDFYHLHNDLNKGVDSIVQYKLGYRIDPKDMRRGDFIEWDWNNTAGTGHAAFVWDVHTNDKGEVDCFLLLSSNGLPLQGKYSGFGVGVALVQNHDKFVKGTAGSYEKVKDPLFVDDDEYVKSGHWLALKDYKKHGDIDGKTFRAKIYGVFYYAQTGNQMTIKEGPRVARFFGFPPPTREQTDKAFGGDFDRAKELAIKDEKQPDSYANGTLPDDPPADEKEPAKKEPAKAAAKPKGGGSSGGSRGGASGGGSGGGPGDSTLAPSVVQLFSGTAALAGTFMDPDAFPGSADSASPRIEHVYWAPNRVERGGTARLSFAGANLRAFQSFSVHLRRDGFTDDEPADYPVVAADNFGSEEITIPRTFEGGSRVLARVEGTAQDGTPFSKDSEAPLYVIGNYPEIKKKGDESEEVRIFQFLLNEQFSLKQRIRVSAVFDDDTVALMHTYQQKNGLLLTDLPTDETWEALDKASTSLPLLGTIRPWKVAKWPTRRFHTNYAEFEGDAWIHQLADTKYDTVDGLAGKSGQPILYISKCGLDTDGKGNNAGDPDHDPHTSVATADGQPLDGDEIPYFALAGGFEHHFGIKHGDVCAVVRQGKVAYGVFGDSGGGYVDGEDKATPIFASDRDANKKPWRRQITTWKRTKAFDAHRSGEGSYKLHLELDLPGKGYSQEENMRSEFVWIVFPGTSLCNARGTLPLDVDADQIKARGEALFKLLGGKPELAG